MWLCKKDEERRGSEDFCRRGFVYFSGWRLLGEKEQDIRA